MKAIDLRTSAYFESLMVSIGVGLLAGAIVAATKNLAVGGVLMIPSLVIFSTHRRVRIDPVSKYYTEYVWLLGFRLGERRNFDRAEYISIRKVRLSQTMNSLVSTATVRKNVYAGYLKISENEKVLIAKRDDKDELVELLRPISAQLNLPLLDYSDAEGKIL